MADLGYPGREGVPYRGRFRNLVEDNYRRHPDVHDDIWSDAFEVAGVGPDQREWHRCRSASLSRRALYGLPKTIQGIS